MLPYTRRELLGLLGSAALAKGRSRPNILYIMADDHAAHAISAYGSRINQTPNIDRLAHSGVRLTNCFCTNSICTPSRAAILTGQYSHKNGVYTLDDPLDPKRNHVAKELQSAGYQTAMIGKWHLASEPTGFDYWNILPGQGVYHNPAFLTSAGRKQYTGYCTDLIGDFTLDWLKQRDPKKPFFAMCHHKAPHRPWEPSAKYKDLFRDRDTPDQGFFLGDHGWFDKRLMYEESLRMPFLMRYPGAIRPGTVNRDMVLNIDFAPMFLDYAGVPTPVEMQGRSFRANLEGHSPRDWRKAM